MGRLASDLRPFLRTVSAANRCKSAVKRRTQWNADGHWERSSTSSMQQTGIISRNGNLDRFGGPCFCFLRRPISAHQLPRPQKNLQEHRLGQQAGIRILQRRMVCRQQMQPIGQRVLSAVSKLNSLPRSQHPSPQKIGNKGIETDLAQTNNDPQSGQQSHFLIQPMSAIALLLRRRLVPWRSAAHRRADPHISQLHAIIPALRIGLRSKPRLVQDWKHEVPRSVASKRPARPVRPMRTRSQTKYHHPSLGIAKRRHRPAPVAPIPPLPASHARNLRAILSQPRAAFAGDDPRIQFFQSAGFGSGIGHLLIVRSRLSPVCRKMRRLGENLFAHPNLLRICPKKNARNSLQRGNSTPNFRGHP